ncbi:hypothetical protein ACGLPC_000784 [Campylobacter jejuni]
MFSTFLANSFSFWDTVDTLLATLNKDLSICSNNKKDFSLALFALFDKLASSPSSLPTFAPSLKL